MPVPVTTNRQTILDLSKADGNILVEPRILKDISFEPSVLSSLPSRDAYLRLRQSLGDLYNTSLENIVLGNGSDELIDNIARARQGRVALTLAPAFERLYEVNEKFGYTTHIHPLSAQDSYQYTDAIHQSFISQAEQLHADLIWLCSPGNPTGTILSPWHICDLAEQLKEAWIIIDAAFIDIVDRELAEKYIEITKKYNNVAILNSFSKTWGIAALRLGFMVANKELAQTIARQSIMFNVNSLAIDIAQHCLDSSDYRQSEFKRVHIHLDAIRAAVSLMPQYELIANSAMNLFCIRHKTLNNLHEKLLNAGIKTKTLDKMPGMTTMGYCRTLVPREHHDVDILLKTLSLIT